MVEIGNALTEQMYIMVFIVIVIGAVILLANSKSKIPEEEIVQRWGQLLLGQADMEDEWIERVEKELDNKGFPYKTFSEEIGEGISGEGEQDLLACKLNGDYCCYIGCIAIGNDLHVNWALRDSSASGCFTIPIIGPILKRVFHGTNFAIMNRVNAFSAATLSATITATEKIMDEKMLDKSQLNRKSSGKLGPL